MKREQQVILLRTGLVLAILLSGVALIPFIDMPVAAINWERLAGIYNPVLTVNATSGAPGSIFAFTGSGYPPNSQATIFVNGDPRGHVSTDNAGGASFLLNTTGAAPGHYNVALEVDINASAAVGIDLVPTDPVVFPPSGSGGPTVFVNPTIFLPLIGK